MWSIFHWTCIFKRFLGSVSELFYIWMAASQWSVCTAQCFPDLQRPDHQKTLKETSVCHRMVLHLTVEHVWGLTETAVCHREALQSPVERVWEGCPVRFYHLTWAWHWCKWRMTWWRSSQHLPSMKSWNDEGENQEETRHLLQDLGSEWVFETLVCQDSCGSGKY